jgi:hypothetical protein
MIEHQLGNYLYILGGYGYNTTSYSRKTFDNLTAIDVPAAKNAVIINLYLSLVLNKKEAVLK